MTLFYSHLLVNINSLRLISQLRLSLGRRDSLLSLKHPFQLSISLVLGNITI